MHLDRAAITQEAMTILRQYGLADVSMRRVATALGVAPGALYWHIDSKQDLIAGMAEAIVGPVLEVPAGITPDPVEVSALLWQQLLGIRDGAEVVIAAVAQPDAAVHTRLIDVFERSVEGWVGGDKGASISQKRAAASGLLHLTLGAASVEQSGSQLAAATGGAASGARDAQAQHRLSVELLLGGLRALDAGM